MARLRGMVRWLPDVWPAAGLLRLAAATSADCVERPLCRGSRAADCAGASAAATAAYSVGHAARGHSAAARETLLMDMVRAGTAIFARKAVEGEGRIGAGVVDRLGREQLGVVAWMDRPMAGRVGKWNVGRAIERGSFAGEVPGERHVVAAFVQNHRRATFGPTVEIRVVEIDFEVLIIDVVIANVGIGERVRIAVVAAAKEIGRVAEHADRV